MIVEPFAVKIPPEPTVKVALAVSARFPTVVSRAVVDDPSLIVILTARRPLVDMVNICGVPAEDWNVTVLNSSSDRFVPAKITVAPIADVKSTLPEPASHEAEVVAFDHAVPEPETVQVSEPRSM